MRKFIRRQVDTIVIRVKPRRNLILSVGAATFFFGFGAGALLNIYLILVHSSLVLQLRSSLTYVSSIIGDGILLPLVNMIVASFLLQESKLITKRLVLSALFLGGVITVYFHVTQAVNKLVNWAMPTPWHWNGLGIWHAIYMLSVTSFLSLFLFVVIKVVRSEKTIPKEAVLVALGVVVFLTLLRLDYLQVSVSQAIGW